MKKPSKTNSNRIENSAIAITATLAEPRLLRNLVEQLADRGYDFGYNLEKVQIGWKAIETSTIEAHVSGDINFSSGNDLINMPFVSCFLFTCSKGKRQDYNLTWASSLS